MNLSFRLAIPGFLSLAFAIGSSGCAGSCEAPVATAELPGPVRATLDRETPGATIKESERETKGGRVVYSIDAEVEGKLWDIAIAEDGTLISKELEK